MFTSIDKVKDWQDLQEKVKEFFIELGYRAETNKAVKLANNGTANVDVYAEKGDSPLAQKILFECKYWNSDIPRGVVQSFKMDVQEAGANFGIIVSKKGFQSGAYEGTTLTTVKLYTFEELQMLFAEEWCKVNYDPINNLHSMLVDEARALQYGTPERQYHDKTAFNDVLKKEKDELENMTRWVLAVFKDYGFAKTTWVTQKPIVHISEISDSKKLKIEFFDARSLAAEYQKLFTEVLNAWGSYREHFGKEFMKLPETQINDFFRK